MASSNLPQSQLSMTATVLPSRLLGQKHHLPACDALLSG
ncbi:hypothetical protein VCR6J2_230293 [Vibrio coralliirubri]|nr:hypothetical protein VCR6J2_230293 [Vibrio coralliirubri]